MKETDITKVLTEERIKQIALAYSILRDAQKTQDAYQDMVVKVFENTEHFEGLRHLRDGSWKVLRNRCYELVRNNKYSPLLLDDSVLEFVDSELEERDSEQIEIQTNALGQCLGSLTENARNIVKLRFYEGLKGSEVAERLGRKPDAVYKALQRIYASLRECIRRNAAVKNRS